MSAAILCRRVLLALAALLLPGQSWAQTPSAATVELMHVLDCGSATSPDLAQWSPGSNQGRPVVMTDPCYLIKHRDGWLLWDTGVDDRLAGLPRGKEVAHKVRGMAGPALSGQLAALKVRPEDITVIAFSHAHFDHVGNARLFPRARWLVQRAEHAAMFGAKPDAYGFLPELYAGMRRNPTTLLDGDRDVFGDGSVRIVSTPGHTPGHQSLLVRLPQIGPVLLSGDVAHSLENFEQRRVPSFNADPAATKRSIEKVERLLREEGAQLWIGHDRNQMRNIIARKRPFGGTGDTDMTIATKPTVVLVHGAFADSSSWNGVVQILTQKGFKVVAAANPLRSVSGDAASVAALVRSMEGPVVLVGHSYGGTVISTAADGLANVKALVFVAAFAPDAGETSLGLSGRFPGSTLAGALAPPVKLADGSADLLIDQAKFPQQFAADLAKPEAALMAVAQRPITDAALNEASRVAAWRAIPSWAIYGTADLNIPPAAMAFMAERAGSRVTVIEGASHVLMISHPKRVAAVIDAAAEDR